MKRFPLFRFCAVSCLGLAALGCNDAAPNSKPDPVPVTTNESPGLIEVFSANAAIDTAGRFFQTMGHMTLPQIHAVVQEIFTGLLFISRPRYMHWMRRAETRFHQLRI